MIKKTLAIILCCCTIITVFSGLGVVGAEQNETIKYSAEELIKKTTDNNTYDSFLINKAYDSGKEAFVLKAEEALRNETGITWTVPCKSNARYALKVRYKVLSDGLADSDCEILINGNLQYKELSGFVLSKEYYDDGEIKQDIFGNEITPDQILSTEMVENYIFDYAGVYSEPLSVNLEAGNNEVRFNYSMEDIGITELIFVPVNNTVTYEEYLDNNSGSKKYNGENILHEGEDAGLKSDTVLYPTSDKSSPKVSPVKTGKILLNTIGGNNWKKANQYIKWNITVPESGLYTISIKVKQNLNVGQQSRRALYINGEIPFKEAENIVIDYSSKWQMLTAGNDAENYFFYLNKGKNEIKLQATLGNTAQVIRAIDNCVNELNVIYRKLLVVLGSEPDLSKDYKLDKNLPDVIEYMTEMADRLDSAATIYEELNGGSNAEVATLQTISRQLRKMNKDSDEVPSEFSYFKTNIGSLGTSQATAKQQPIEIDYFVLAGEESQLPQFKGNFIEDFIFSFKEFCCSFVIDYKNIGALEEMGENTTSLKAWVSSGRDQAQIMRSLISDNFTPNTGYRVKLELVSAASLLPATVAGIGPDVFIGLGSASVIDYSMRNAAVNLKEFSDFEEVAANFYDASFIPLQYMGGIYGIPMSMSFNVLYYREDILEELGLSIPQTWDDVVAMSSVLAVNNMSFGLPSGNQSFLMMLRQKNLNIYNQDSTVCLLDTAEAIDVFQYYTNFYSNYGFPVTYSLMNRFRTGETPVAVDNLSVYNSLEISAPEIKGLWNFTVVPGFADENGEVNHTSLVSGAATLLLRNSKQHKAGWEFIKWWSSADIQTAYGLELESRLGSSGRYTSANKQALLNSCWNKKELEVLTKQLETVSAVEQVPGGYYLSRNLDNAFRNAVYYNKKPMDVMFDYVYKINGELSSKRSELGLPTAEDKLS